MSSLTFRVVTGAIKGILRATCKIDDDAGLARSYPRQARGPFNVTGHPAVSLPAGLDSTGLPLSFQLVAPHFSDARLLQISLQYQQATRFDEAHPDL